MLTTPLELEAECGALSIAFWTRCTAPTRSAMDPEKPADSAEAHPTHRSAADTLAERDLLRRLFDAMPQLGWTAQPDGFIDYYNRGWYEYTGSTYEEMKGWGWQASHHPDELPRVMESWGRSIATGKPWEIEFPLRRHDGVYRWFLSRATPIYDEAGTLVRWVGINTDIDDQKRAERQLAELDRAKTTFFSNVSHELRTPLTLILGPLEDAARSSSGTLSGPGLEVAQRNAFRLLKLVNTLLDFSRIEAGRTQASYVQTDISALTREIASAFESAIQSAGLRFEVDCPTVEGPVYVDHDMWEKVVLNLLSNALKFTFEGTITVRLRRAENAIALEVHDTGIGIAEPDLPHVFERFRRVVDSRARTHEGSGIGLALVKELVQLHGGSVSVESKLAHGTTFVVRIPVGDAHLPADSIGVPPTLASTALGAAPYVQEALRWLPGDAVRASVDDDAARALVNVPHDILGARVLVADDNADMRDYLEHRLSQLWNVEMVSDGAQALAAARRQTPDLVLTDVMMPILDGFCLLRELRSDDALEHVPVIMLSARAGEESRIEGLEAGADDYLVKPFAARELIARVSTHIQLARLHRLAEGARQNLLGMLDQAPVAISVHQGPDHRFTLVNARYCAQTMRSAAELIGQRVVDVFPQVKGTEILAAVDAAYHEGATTCFEEAEGILVRPDGTAELHYYNITIAPMRDLDGTINGSMSVSLDVTEPVRNRRDLEIARAGAEEANRAKDDFMAMLGHELRNPLSPILSALHLIRLRGADRITREVDLIERQVKHLVRLVDDLLDVSRIAGGKVALARERVEIADVIASAIETASPVIENGRHRLNIDVPKQGLVVDVDRVRMSQVIANLLTNAAKYTLPGGRIDVSAKRDDGQVVVHIQDNGAGIAPELLPHVFDLFVQARQTLARSQGGLGLGLTIVKSLVTVHGGSVMAHSDGLGHGSTFTVRLPALEMRPDTRLEPTPLPAFESRHQRVLVVDDNQDAADLLAMTLQMLGYQTAIANDGPEALRVAREFHPDTALLDIGLPAMDGYELAQRMRLQAGPALRLIAVTGYGQETDRQRSRAAGFEEHLTKPVDLDLLAKLLESTPAGKSPWTLRGS